MKRFKTDVKVFVLNERSEGKGWKVIKERIRQRFNIEPPTTRAMQKWEKRLDRAALNAELMKDLKGEMPVIEAEAQLRFAQDLLPTLWKAREAGRIWSLPAGNGSCTLSITDLATRDLIVWSMSTCRSGRNRKNLYASKTGGTI